jgi:serine/threonine protein kinase
MFSIKRNWETYKTCVDRLAKAKLKEVVEVFALCRCSTEMEFLNGYQIFDNTSKFTPPRHRSRCWLDEHTLEEANVILEIVAAAVEKIHTIGVVHTDITGFNLLVRGDRDVKIVDLSSCVPADALGPIFLARNLRIGIGRWIETRQMHRYLIDLVHRRFQHRLL